MSKEKSVLYDEAKCGKCCHWSDKEPHCYYYNNGMCSSRGVTSKEQPMTKEPVYEQEEKASTRKAVCSTCGVRIVIPKAQSDFRCAPCKKRDRR